MAGAFQTSREIFSNPIWKNILEFRLFFLIYGNAMYSDGVKVSNDLILQRGQWLRSTRKLQEDLQYIENQQTKTYSVSAINRCVKRLVVLKRVSTRTHTLGTVFTVLNYQQYQCLSAPKADTLEQTLEQPWNNNNKDNKDSSLRTKRLKHIVVSSDDIPYTQILNLLNELTGKRFRDTTEATRKLIAAKWKDEYKFEDFEFVIRHKVAEWTGTKYEKYLQPSTLFGPKFENYVNEKAVQKRGTTKREDIPRSDSGTVENDDWLSF